MISSLFLSHCEQHKWCIFFVNRSQCIDSIDSNLDFHLPMQECENTQSVMQRVFFPPPYKVSFIRFLCHFPAHSLRIKQLYYVSKPLELKAAKDRHFFFLSVWESFKKNYLLTLKEPWNNAIFLHMGRWETLCKVLPKEPIHWLFFFFLTFNFYYYTVWWVWLRGTP